MDRIPISALQHYRYCPRQCALIHVEQTFDENLYTLRGHRAHDRVDEPGADQVRGERRERALPIWSDAHGLIGKADVVAFPEDGPPYPIEHKVGKRKAQEADEVQLCAQALCLEEMFETTVLEGFLYYRSSRTRRRVELDETLRALTLETVALVREMLEADHVPDPVDDERCPPCSLETTCMPSAVARLQEERQG